MKTMKASHSDVDWGQMSRGKMDVRVRNLESEVTVLKDTVWRMTSRILTLETFITDKLGCIVVDFGTKLGNINSTGRSSTGPESSPPALEVIETTQHDSGIDGESGVRIEPINGASDYMDNQQEYAENPEVSIVDTSVEHLEMTPNVPEFFLHASLAKASANADSIRNVGADGTHANFRVNDMKPDFEESKIFFHTVDDDNDYHLERSNKQATEQKMNNKISIKCSKCKMTFFQKWQYQAHAQRHIREESMYDPRKKYECSYCQKRFKSKPELVVHTRTHTGEKPYHCNQCGRNFSQCSSLKTHKRLVHSEERPYQCHICHKKFPRTSNLQKHLVGVHRLN